jgi:hypothetical protein
MDKEYFFIDGGLNFTSQKMKICKQCVLNHNMTLKSNKYFDEQIFAQYYGAKMVISGQKLSKVCLLIDNGIKMGSNRMGIQNFLYLFGVKHGLSSYSKQMKKIYDSLDCN